MKKLMVTFVVSGFLISQVHAQDTLSFKATTDGLQNFYQNPTKEKFNVIQASMVVHSNKIPKRNEIQLAVWAYEVHKQHGWEIHANFYQQGIKALQDKKSTLSQYIAGDVMSPTKLDIWWSKFSASGDTKYAYKVFKQIKSNANEKDINTLMVSKASSWSFTSNCKNHKKIRSEAKAWIKQKGLNNAQVTILKKCLK